MTIYFINERGGNCCLKIGYTGKDVDGVEERLAQLQTGNSVELGIFGEIPDGSVALERAIQAHFSEYYVRGEWFNIPQDILEKFMDDIVWPWATEAEIFEYLGLNMPDRKPRREVIDINDPDNWRVERREYVKANGETSVYINYRRRKGKMVNGKRENIYSSKNKKGE